MPLPDLNLIIKDLKAHKDVTTRLKNVFNLPEQQLSRTKRLDFTKSVLAEVQFQTSQHAHDAFLLAVGSLRKLAPFLNSKGQSLLETNTRIERYAVNHASALTFSKEPVNDKLQGSAVGLVEESLKILFEFRDLAPRKSNTIATRRRNFVRGSEKENTNPNPQFLSEELYQLCDTVLDRCLFIGASACGLEAFLPQSDATSVASVISSALVIKLYAMTANISLPNLLAFAKQIVVPWVRFHSQSVDASDRRNYKNMNCIQTALFNAARLQQKNDPCGALRARAYALTLGDITLKQYAKELLRSVHALTRGNVIRPRNVFDVVASVYDEALQFVASFSYKDQHWFAEDVSAWLDHVGLVWSQRSESPSIPAVFEGRISASRRTKDNSQMLQICRFQLHVLHAGLYGAKGTATTQNGNFVFDEEAFQTISDQLPLLDLPGLDSFPRKEKSLKSSGCSARSAERLGLNRLRALRVLEPIRRSILVSARDATILPSGALRILETYVSAVLAGLIETNTASLKVSKDEADSIAEIRVRLGKMCEATFEAIAEVVRAYFEAGLEEVLVNLVRCTGLLLNLYAEFSREHARKRKLWICEVFRSELGNTLKHVQRLSNEDRIVTFRRVASVGEECEREWFTEQENDVLQKRIRADLLLVVRSGHSFLKNWSTATKFSVQRVTVLLSLVTHSSKKSDVRLLHTACLDFVKDIVAVTLEPDADLSIILESDSPIDFLLGAVMEYCTPLRAKLSASPDCEKHHNILRGLRIVRIFLLEKLKNCSGDLCLQREFHIAWLLLIRGRDEDKAALQTVIDSFSRTTAPTCRHLSPHNFFSPGDSLHCSDDHRFFIQALFRTVMSIVDDDLINIKAGLERARAIMLTSKCLTRDFELLYVSLEILQWVESVAALNDLGNASTIALELWQACDEALGISTASTTVATHCIQLAQLGIQQEVWTIPRIYADDAKCNKNETCRKKTRNVVTLTEFMGDLGPEGMFDLVSQLNVAHRELKSALMPFLSRSRYHALSQRSCHIAGVDIDLSHDIKDERGRDILQSLLLLIRSLYRMGHVLLLIENLTDGRYYIERCQFVASQCLPPSNCFYQSISVIGPMTAATVVELQDPSQLIAGTLLSTKTSNYEKDPRSVFLLKQTIAMAVLDRFSNRFTRSVHEEIGDAVLKLHEECEQYLERMTDEEYHISAVQLDLSRGITYAFMDNYTLALDYLMAIGRNDIYLSKNMKAVVWYFMASALIAKKGGLYCIKEGSHNNKLNRANAPRRVTRSQRKKEEAAYRSYFMDTTLEELQELLNRSIKESHSCRAPRLERRILSLQGFITQEDHAAVRALQKAIGLTFNIRWDVARRNKASRSRADIVTERSACVEELENAFKSMGLSQNGGQQALFQISELLGLLERTVCVVVGLSVDETRKNLLLWRLSPNGILLHRVGLPKTSEVSFSGISERITKVISKMKEMSVKAGHSFTEVEKQAWWKHRYSLDDKVKDIIADVEAEWFAEFKMLLIPFIFNSTFLAERKFRKGDAKAHADLCASVVGEGLLNDITSGTAIGDRSTNDAMKQNVIVGQLVLVMDTVLEAIPWESLPVLRDMQISVTRAPSLAFLYSHLRNRPGVVDSRNLMYVINPAGDLQRTEETFREHHGFQKWVGFFGKTSREEVVAAYGDQGIYLYCGHGAGDQYISPRGFSKRGEAPIALLMGCSSARPSNFNMGDCESNGPAVDYLVQGSLAVVGNLWDVGDRDIDRFTIALISHWLGVDNNGERHGKRLNLAEAVAASRSACRLPFLVGAATVVIGAPNIRTGLLGPETESTFCVDTSYP